MLVAVKVSDRTPGMCTESWSNNECSAENGSQMFCLRIKVEAKDRGTIYFILHCLLPPPPPPPLYVYSLGPLTRISGPLRGPLSNSTCILIYIILIITE